MITLNKIKKFMEVAKIASSLWMILVYISTKGISLQYWENPDLENPPYYTY